MMGSTSDHVIHHAPSPVLVQGVGDGSAELGEARRRYTARLSPRRACSSWIINLPPIASRFGTVTHTRTGTGKGNRPKMLEHSLRSSKRTATPGASGRRSVRSPTSWTDTGDGGMVGRFARRQARLPALACPEAGPVSVRR